MAAKDRITMNPGEIQFHGDDERADGEPTQPGDLVIEIRNGKPVVYTQPKGVSGGNQARSSRTATPSVSDTKK